jgi:hypothetical protein
MSILAAVIASNFLASLAFAVDGSAPWNPYCDANRTPNRQSRPHGSGSRSNANHEALKRYNRNPRQYPEGPNGKRIVGVAFRPEHLNPANCRPLIALNRQIATTAAQIQQLDDMIRQYTQSLWLIAQYKNASQAHYNAYVYLSKQLNNTNALRHNASGALRDLQVARNRIVAKFATRKPTRLVWCVRNHLKRTYVPTNILHQKALQYILDHPELMGTTIRLYF